MTYISPFSNNILVFHLIKACSHFIILLSLLVYQFSFNSFTYPYLYISLYLLCGLAFLQDTIGLVFHKETQKWLYLLFLFIEALFLSGLVFIIGPVGLMFVFILLWIQILPLALDKQFFLSLVFLLYISILLPIAFLAGHHKLMFEDRFSLVVFISTGLVFILGLVSLISFSLLRDTKTQISPSEYTTSSDLTTLKLIKKLQFALHSLTSYFTKIELRTDKTNEFIKKGMRKIREINTFVVNFVTILSPKIELLSKTVDIKILITELLAELTIHHTRPENLKEVTKYPSYPLQLKGDFTQLKQAFKHLIINAFEALKNKQAPEIKIHGFIHDHWLTIEIIDNGHGIEPEDMKNLFHPFFSNRLGLRGLGLPYVKKIITAHNALLDITSNQTETKVTIQFPLIRKKITQRVLKKAA